MKNWRTAIQILALVGMVGVIAFGLTMCAQEIHKDKVQAVESAQADSQHYGVAISPHQGRRCLNGWLIVKIGVHAWVYPRDSLGELVPCE